MGKFTSKLYKNEFIPVKPRSHLLLIIFTDLQS